MKITLKKMVMAALLIAAIMIALASISFADNQTRKKELKRDQNYVARQMEIWEDSRMRFRYQAMSLRVKNLEEENQRLETEWMLMDDDLTVALWAKLNAYEEISKLVFMLETMQAIADLAGIKYPLYVTGSEGIND